MSRHKAREAAFQMLFQLIEGENDLAAADLTLAEAGLSPEAEQFARDLARGALTKRFETAEYIRKFTSGWQLERLFSVDRLLLQLAIYELKYGGEAPAIVINEAVELAKVYGSDESPAFINAVLDNFRDKVLEQKLPEYQPSEEDIAAAMAKAASKKPQPEAETLPEPPRPAPAMPITEQMGKRKFRKIGKAEQTEADKILPEPEEDEFGRERKPF